MMTMRETQSKELGRLRLKRQRQDIMEMRQLLRIMFSLETARQSRIRAKGNTCERVTATAA
jgi:hypothetical protein